MILCYINLGLTLPFCGSTTDTTGVSLFNVRPVLSSTVSGS